MFNREIQIKILEKEIDTMLDSSNIDHLELEKLLDELETVMSGGYIKLRLVE